MVHSDLSLDFGSGGNAYRYLEGGWATAEKDFTWAVGQDSFIDIPSLTSGFDHLLVLLGGPFIRKPTLISQTIEVWIDGVLIAKKIVSGEFRWAIWLPRTLINQGRIKVNLRHPDCCRPAEFGSEDNRLLGVAYKFIFVHAVGRVKPFLSPEYWRVDRYHNGPDLSAFCLENSRMNEAAASTDLYEEVCAALKAANAQAVRKAIRGHVSGDVAVDFVDGTDLSLFECKFSCNAPTTLIFSRSLGENANALAARVVASRFAASLTVIDAYIQGGRMSGRCVFSLGDEAHVDGVAFCSKGSGEVFLMPDPDFLKSKGYASLREHITRKCTPWEQRRNVALWRGSSTGYGHESDIRLLPRVRLCKLSREVERLGLLDAGFTSLTRPESQREEDVLRSLRLCKDYVEADRLQDWKFHIDIDGNTSSWSGLYLKLLSGGVVLKVNSEGGWRQWYYDRLKPFENYVPVLADLSDLVEKIQFYSRNDELALRIARSGRELATSMTYENQLVQSVERVEQAVIADAVSRIGISRTQPI